MAGVGTPADSSIVNGVVCRKNIAHKRMRRRIENAKILMVGGNVEFNRTQSRLTSLESVTKQQVQKLFFCCMRNQYLHLHCLLEVGGFNSCGFLSLAHRNPSLHNNDA